jgi:hypothetical protein
LTISTTFYRRQDITKTFQNGERRRGHVSIIVGHSEIFLQYLRNNLVFVGANSGFVAIYGVSKERVENVDLFNV